MTVISLGLRRWQLLSAAAVKAVTYSLLSTDEIRALRDKFVVLAMIGDPRTVRLTGNQLHHIARVLSSQLAWREWLLDEPAQSKREQKLRGAIK